MLKIFTIFFLASDAIDILAESAEAAEQEAITIENDTIAEIVEAEFCSNFFYGGNYFDFSDVALRINRQLTSTEISKIFERDTKCAAYFQPLDEEDTIDFDFLILSYRMKNINDDYTIDYYTEFKTLNDYFTYLSTSYDYIHGYRRDRIDVFFEAYKDGFRIL